MRRNGRETRPRSGSTGRWIAATLLVACALACAPTPGRGESASTAAAGQEKGSTPTIRPLVPATDSIGVVPARFEWTPVEGADRYAINVYNDVDRLLWRQDDLRVPSVARPDELELESGTYFWRVSAMGDGRMLADSGWSAFIVRTEK